MLNAAEIADMRQTLEESLPADAVVQRLTPGTPDDAGEVTPTWVVVATTKARVAPYSRPYLVEPVYGERPIGASRHTITLPADTDVQPSDQVVITDRGVTEAYIVIEVEGPRSYELSRRLVAERRQ